MSDAMTVVEATKTDASLNAELFADYPDLLTPAHIAKITGFTVQYVRKLCRQGKLPAVQIGMREWFVPKLRFIAYVMGGGDDH